MRKQGDSRSSNIKRVEHAVETVRIKAHDFERLYDNLKDQLQMESYELQYDTHVRMRQMQATSEGSRSLLLESLSTQATSQQVNDLTKMVKSIDRDRQEEAKPQSSMLAQNFLQVRAINSLLQFIQSGFDNPPVQDGSSIQLLVPAPHSLVRSIFPGPAPTRPIHLMTIDELIQVLRIPLRMANNDLQHVVMSKTWLRNGAAVRTLLNYTAFQQWLSGPGSQALLVDGADVDHEHDALSAMSILAVEIMTSIMQSIRQGQAAVIHFFCGLHSLNRRPEHGGQVLDLSDHYDLTATSMSEARLHQLPSLRGESAARQLRRPAVHVGAAMPPAAAAPDCLLLHGWY